MSAPQVTDLILHRGPAVLLERILEVSPTRCIASVRLEPGAWYLQADGTAPAWVGLEWMAQAAAAFSGHRHREAGPRNLRRVEGPRGARAGGRSGSPLPRRFRPRRLHL